jgi:tetratricopeptide (TPR) repeat protein
MTTVITEYYILFLSFSNLLICATGRSDGAAQTYHQLGTIAQEQRDFQTAEAWNRKSLAIFEKRGDEHGAAFTYATMGLLAAAQERYVNAVEWFIKSIHGFVRTHDKHFTQTAVRELIRCHQQANDNDQQAIHVLWDQTALGPFPENPGD